jgi:hypothetical protein
MVLLLMVKATPWLKIAPPPSMPAAVLPEKVLLLMVTRLGWLLIPALVPMAPPPPFDVLPEKVLLLMVKVPPG